MNKKEIFDRIEYVVLPIPQIRNRNRQSRIASSLY